MRDNLKDLQNNLRQRQGMKPKKSAKPMSVKIAGPAAVPAPPVQGDAKRMGPPAAQGSIGFAMQVGDYYQQKLMNMKGRK